MALPFGEAVEKALANGLVECEFFHWEGVNDIKQCTRHSGQGRDVAEARRFCDVAMAEIVKAGRGAV